MQGVKAMTKRGSYTRACSVGILNLLRRKLTKDELDRLAAVVAYDTGYLQEELAELAAQTKHQTKCETEYNLAK